MNPCRTSRCVCRNDLIMKQANAACQKIETRRVKVDYQDMKSAAYIDAIIYYVETLLGIRFKSVKKDTIRKFKIGYAPPYSDEQHQGRALVGGFLLRFEKDYTAFNAFSDGGLVRHLNDETVKGYGYYCRQIDFRRKDPFSRNYGDYFAFYNLLQDQNKPVVVSTLGSYLTPEAANLLKGLDIEHFIAAYDWDVAGRNSIERIASKLGGWVYYLGGLAEGQDPYDMLKPVVNAISGFSLKH